MAASTRSSPYLPTRPAYRSAATALALRWARRSPRTISGSRTLPRMSRSTSSCISPRRTIRTGRIRSPSWNASRTSTICDPGTAPPMSAWWAMLTANPTSRPSAKRGEVMKQSG